MKKKSITISCFVRFYVNSIMALNMALQKIFFYIIIFLVIHFNVNAQDILQQKLDGSEKGKSLIAFIEEFEKKYPVRFYFIDDWISSYRINQDYSGNSLSYLLTDLFVGSDLSFELVHPHAIVIIKDPTPDQARNKALLSATISKTKVEVIRFGEPSELKPGGRVILKGRITDAEDKIPLGGVTLRTANDGIGVVTQSDGRFEISMKGGSQVLIVNHVNYEEEVLDIEIYRSSQIDLVLEEKPIILKEITVSADQDLKLLESRVGQLRLSVIEGRKQPSLMGEADIVRQLQVLPGVTTVGEAAAGFNVRGGSVDQNLILYDGMPIFNTAHALGFFSAFNSDAIQDLNFFRGGLPPEYGGRISSVLDIHSRVGNAKRWKVNGGLGMISTNLTVSGPLAKDKTKLFVSARTTYADWFLDMVRTNYIDLKQSEVGFFDGVFRIDHQFSPRTSITWSTYISNDRLRIKGDTTFGWSNVASSIKIHHDFTKKITASLLAGLGNYQYDVIDRFEVRAFNLFYRISYPFLKGEVSYSSGQHLLKTGIQSIYYGFEPGKLTAGTGSSSVVPADMPDQRSLESAFFISDSWAISPKIQFDVGLRLSTFQQLGPAEVNLYTPSSPILKNNLSGKQSYSSNEIIKTYWGLEPRASLRYSIIPNLAVKASYHRTFQYLHLVSNTAAITPVDVWQPSNTFLKPQASDQVSLGFYKDFKERKYEAYIEGFYKSIDNILEFKDGAQLILNSQLEADLLQGRGWAYGIETYLSKKQGRLTWTMNYTYSRSWRQVKGATRNESINSGDPYPSNFDQPHNVNLNWSYKISRRHYFTGNFSYRTGRPITAPVFGFNFDGYEVAFFSDRNQFRIPDYHRLDIAFVIDSNHKKKKLWSGSWTISFLNVYAHKNPYSFFFQPNESGVLQPYQLSILGTIVPSVMYSFKI